MDSKTDLHFEFSQPSELDGKAVADLVRAVGSLEPNTTYAYLLLCSHFSDTCVVARHEGTIVGALLGYRMPAQPHVLFIWQIGTAQEMRGKGLGRAMLTALRERARSKGITHFAQTIAPSNEASWGLFRSWARRSGLTLTEGEGFSRDVFGGEDHEPEALVTIGPL